jgi:hypothetical protein
MTIPEVLQEIQKRHVIAAMRQIDKEGTVPKRRNSTKFSIKEDRILYPPKYVICRAAQLATGLTLIPNDHSGGEQSNKKLRDLGFTIVNQASSFVERP